MSGLTTSNLPTPAEIARRLTPERVQQAMRDGLRQGLQDLHVSAQEIENTVRQVIRQELPDLLEPFLRQSGGALNIADTPAQPNGSSETDGLNALIDEARDLIRQGMPVSARARLLQIQQEHAGFLSPSIEFRLASNLAACAWEVDDLDTAVVEIQRALDLQPDNPKALANAALMALLEDDYVSAAELAEKARAFDHKVDNGAAVYIQACGRLKRQDDITRLERTEPWILADSHCTLALAQASMDMSRYGEAERFARTSIALKDDNPYAHFLLAQAIALPLQERINSNPPFRWRMDHFLIEQAEQALDALNRMLDIIKEYENPRLRLMALASRSGILDVLGRDDEALADCDEIIATNTSTDTARDNAYINKGVALLRSGRFAEAAACYEQVKQEETRQEIVVHLSLCYLEIDEPERAVDAILPVWDVNSSDFHQIEIAGILLRAYHLLGKGGEAQEVCTQLLERSPAKAEADLLVAEQRLREQNHLEALTHARASLAVLPHQAPDGAHLRLGQVLYELGEYKEAAGQFALLISPGQFSPLQEQYIACLYNAHMLREALDQARAVRASQGVQPTIAEIEALVSESMGDRNTASLLRKQLADLNPRNAARHRIHSAYLDLQDGNNAAACEVLNRVSFDEIKEDALALTNTAQLRAQLGMPDALVYGYRARKLAFDRPEVHRAYISLLLFHEQRDGAALMPTNVEVGCAVKVVLNGERRVFIIEAEEEHINREKGELHPGDPLASKLMGAKQGDTITIKERAVRNITCSVEEVLSKYVFAFQESMQNYEAWFPTAPGLQGFHVAEDDFSELLAFLRHQEEQTNTSIEHFRQHQITLSGFSRLMGRNLFEIWAGVTSPGGLGLFASTMEAPQWQNELEAVQGVTEIVIDVTALFTLLHLELEAQFAQTFETIWVAQAVEDEIRAILSSALQEKPHPVMGSMDGQPFIVEVGQEEIEQRRQFLQRTVDFLTTNTKVVPTAGLLDIEPEELERLTQAFGQSSVSSILLAKEKETLFYSDDALLRLLAEQKWEVRGIWSQAALFEMGRREKITETEYAQALERLIVSNYKTPVINAPFLVWLLERYDLQIAPSVTKAFAILEGPVCSEESALIVCAQVVLQLWWKYPPQKQGERMSILKLCVDKLLIGRDANRVIYLFKCAVVLAFRHAAKRLMTLPLFLPEILEFISRFSPVAEAPAVTSQPPQSRRPAATPQRNAHPPPSKQRKSSHKSKGRKRRQ